LASHDFAPPEAKLSLLEKSPARCPGRRAAVVLDCEMVGIRVGQHEIGELVRLCAVDFLAGEIVVDIYVIPEQPVVAWRTIYSGVTKTLLEEMKRQGRTVDGWQAARKLLWQHIDEDTILIGHSLHHDLKALGMIHARVIDSAIVTKEAVEENYNRSWALKTLCQQFLGREIQAGAAGHDCLEDTFAAREILLWSFNHPDRLIIWADVERGLIATKKAEKLAAKKEKDKAEEMKTEKAATKKSSTDDNPVESTSSGTDSSDSEMARVIRTSSG
jgi:hypothetical protein